MFEGLVAMIIAAAMVIAGIVAGIKGDEPMGSDIVVTIIPPMPNYAPDVTSEESEWALFHAESLIEHSEAFDAYFNALEFKRAKNGASMIRRPGDKSFRFVKKG